MVKRGDLVSIKTLSGNFNALVLNVDDDNKKMLVQTGGDPFYAPLSRLDFIIDDGSSFISEA